METPLLTRNLEKIARFVGISRQNSRIGLVRLSRRTHLHWSAPVPGSRWAVRCGSRNHELQSTVSQYVKVALGSAGCPTHTSHLRDLPFHKRESLRGARQSPLTPTGNLQHRCELLGAESLSFTQKPFWSVHKVPGLNPVAKPGPIDPHRFWQDISGGRSQGAEVRDRKCAKRENLPAANLEPRRPVQPLHQVAWTVVSSSLSCLDNNDRCHPLYFTLISVMSV